MEIFRGLEILPEAIDLAARELAPHKIVTWVETSLIPSRLSS
ncbi:MAG: hypothetical protein Ct9H90mP5_05000 [Acidimicrobiaceae bacterium]|nr:MAG: hypothetical protein Ct9H90mP5_05000 [Acidimicrobiaceae bacterium]